MLAWNLFNLVILGISLGKVLGFESKWLMIVVHSAHILADVWFQVTLFRLKKLSIYLDPALKTEDSITKELRWLLCFQVTYGISVVVYNIWVHLDMVLPTNDWFDPETGAITDSAIRLPCVVMLYMVHLYFFKSGLELINLCHKYSTINSFRAKLFISVIMLFDTLRYAWQIFLCLRELSMLKSETRVCSSWETIAEQVAKYVNALLYPPMYELLYLAIINYFANTAKLSAE